MPRKVVGVRRSDGGLRGTATARALIVARWKRKRNVAMLWRVLMLLRLVVWLRLLLLVMLSRVCSHARLPFGVRVVHGCIGVAITCMYAGNCACLVIATLALALTLAACTFVTRAAAASVILVIVIV